MKRNLLVAIFIAGAITLTSGAGAQTALTSDQSDIWWNAGESGWGMQIVQEGNASFATLYVYDSQGQPTFFTATLAADSAASWSGDLYLTTGPYYGNPVFNPAQVTARKVGALNFTRANSDSGTLSYAVNGVAVTKTVTRQLLRNEDYSGNYFVAMSMVTTHCSAAADNLTRTAAYTLNIAQQNSAMTITGDFMNRALCTYSGTYVQSGKIGAVGASYTCTGGDEGNLNFFELTRRAGMVSGRVQGHSISDSCDYVGTFTGLLPN